MVKYSLEDIVDHFSYEGVNLNRTQLKSLITLYDPNTGELSSIDPTFRDWIASHMFSKHEYTKYKDNRDNGYVFADIILRGM